MALDTLLYTCTSMGKQQYRINPQTLQFETAKRSKRERWFRVMLFSGIFAVIAVVSIMVFDAFFESPRTRELTRENDFLQKQVASMNAQLDTLSVVMTDLVQKDEEIYRNVFGAEPYPEHLRRAGIGGSDRYKALRGYESTEELVETQTRISRLERSLVAQSHSLEELFDMARNKEAMLKSIPAIQPVSNEDLTRIASGFGYRIHPIYRVPKMHTGVDFSAPTGTDIYATGNGVVERVEKKHSGYGYNVIVNHGYGYKTLYAHMSKILVTKGQQVQRGEVIGLVGNTGRSVGPHLHYEVIKDSKKVNPANYFFNDLTPEQYEQVLEKAQEGSHQSFD